MGLPTLMVVRSTDLTGLAQNGDRSVPWSSAPVNTGPSTWWSSGAASNVVMPWAGPYLCNIHVAWDSNTTGRRSIHLNRSTTVNSANFEIGHGIESTYSTEASAYQQISEILEVPTAGETYILTVFHNAGTSPTNDRSLTNRVTGSEVYAAKMSFVYLGD